MERGRHIRPTFSHFWSYIISRLTCLKYIYNLPIDRFESIKIVKRPVGQTGSLLPLQFMFVPLLLPLFLCNKTATLVESKKVQYLLTSTIQKRLSSLH